MRINVQKTKVILYEAYKYGRVKMKIRANHEIEQVDEFTYLGSVIRV